MSCRPPRCSCRPSRGRSRRAGRRRSRAAGRRHARPRPTDRAAQSEARPVRPASRRESEDRCSRPSVALVEVAALEQVAVAVVLLDVVVQLEEVLHDLRRRVALRPRVVGEGQDDELRVRRRRSPLYGSLGTKPTNHEWNGRRPWLSRVPNSAVPDLPATLIGRSTRL